MSTLKQLGVYIQSQLHVRHYIRPQCVHVQYVESATSTLKTVGVHVQTTTVCRVSYVRLQQAHQSKFPVGNLWGRGSGLQDVVWHMRPPGLFTPD